MSLSFMMQPRQKQSYGLSTRLLGDAYTVDAKYAAMPVTEIGKGRDYKDDDRDEDDAERKFDSESENESGEEKSLGRHLLL
ncbi:hypothetical protein BG003_004190 [Podila horticola]|nr:hypothetical protein BG003_004190 [Podila horticola]